MKTTTTTARAAKKSRSLSGSDFVQNTDFGICLVNRDFEILWANKTQTKWFGSLKELCGKHCYETFERRQSVCANCPVLTTFTTGKPAHSEPRTAFTKDGKTRFYELSTAPLKDKNGEVREVLEIVRDITERKRLEDDRARLMTALDAATDFIMITDLDGSILYINLNLASRMGYRKDQMVGKNAELLLGKGNPPQFASRLLARTLEGGQWKTRGWITRKNGTRMRCDIATSLVQGDGGRPIAVVGISRDMTQERAQKKELIVKTRALRALNKQLNALNGTLSAKSEKLKKANEEIRLLNRSLGEKVKVRTKELEIANEELVTLYTIGRQMVSTLDLGAVLSTIVDTVSTIIRADASAVWLADHQRAYLTISASCGLDRARQTRQTSLKTDLLFADAPRPDHISIVRLTGTPPGSIIADLFNAGYRSMAVIPIIFKNDLLGAITMLSHALLHLSRNEKELLEAFASQAAIAIKNARLHENVNLNYYNTITTLSLAMEARDPYTRGHAERVTNYAVAIAKILRLPREEIEIIRYAGKIHDIGKIAIPDSILLKPGRLTPAERAQVELHAIKGVDIISHLKFLESGAPIIKHHHERFDGAGYPDGLRALEIPLGARILTVADAFDAMTSERPYRSALAFEESINDLRQNAGKQFDPRIVDAFLTILCNTIAG